MLEAARKHLRDTVAPGDSLQAVEAKVAAAAPGADEEMQSALWLYGWHRAAERADRRRRVVRAAPTSG